MGDWYWSGTISVRIQHSGLQKIEMNLPPEWKIAGWLIGGGYAVWKLTRLDAMSHSNVELRRHQWEGKSTYEKQFKKTRQWMRLIILIIIMISLAAAIESAFQLLR